MPTRITVSSAPLYDASISPLIYGDFIEFLNDLIPGMWAEKVQDRSFEGVLQPRYTWPPEQCWEYPRWQPFLAGLPCPSAWPGRAEDLEAPGAAVRLELDPRQPFVGRHSPRVEVQAAGERPFVAGIAQTGIAVKQGERLELEIYLRAPAGQDLPIRVLLGRNYGAFFRSYAALELRGVGPDWARFGGTLTPDASDEDAMLALGIAGEGAFWADKVSLLPADHCRGWRRDVVEAVRAMKPGILRFGGSSLIYYQWQQGIGPRERRAPFVNRPWGNQEENDVGLHEFLEFCELVEAEPLLCLNANSATLEQVLAEIEYCNGPADSPYGRLRAEAGHPEPFHVRYWQIGNEQSGPEYEQLLITYAQAIRERHPDLALLASYPSDSILDLAGIDYVCPHFYAPYSPAAEAELRALIRQIRQTAKNPDLKVAITEWNHTAGHWGWARAWLLTLYNALNAARTFHMFQRLGDMVRIANRSNLVNSCCSGVIQTSPTDLYLTPCYHVQRAYAAFAGDQALTVSMESAEGLDVAATRHGSHGEVALFVVNIAPQARRCRIDLSDLALSSDRSDLWTLTGPSLDSVNSFQEKERVAPREACHDLPGPEFEHDFPPYSVSVLRFPNGPGGSIREPGRRGTAEPRSPSGRRDGG
jgi:alpha-N-arabinofuranosidase